MYTKNSYLNLINNLRLSVVLLLLFNSSWLVAAEAEPTLQNRPNILLIVADDLGFSDLGSYGGEIETPNLNKLAEDGGTKFTNFHVAPTCSPTRSMLMSGTYNHRAGLGAMAEWVAENQKDKPGYEGYLNSSVVSLPELLKDAGYRTFMAGKWHLGMEPEQGPDKRGFDESFAMLPGAGNHYSDKGLVPDLPTIPYRENGKTVVLPKDFYSTDFYTNKIIEYIDDSVKSANTPFFGYVAYTSPHWPLQVDKKYSDKYKGRYNNGYASIQSERLKKIEELGLFEGAQGAATGNSCYPDWQQLSIEERARQARMMEVYAGMVDSLDENIGKLIQHLKDIGEYENTFIVFMSDNGADARPERGLGGESDFMQKNYNNKFDNIGAGNSFVSYGGAWAQVGSTPLRLHKGMTTEGGIRAPAIIHFPDGQIRGGIERGFVSVMDLMPTFLNLAKVTHPGTSYKDRDVLPIKGKSILPLLKGSVQRVHQDEVYGFSVHRRQGIQFNDWKIVQLPAPYGNGQWKLYNLHDDPSESIDLSISQPVVMQEMINRWDAFVIETGIIVSSENSRSPGECMVLSSELSD
jgi:arylsulfatase A-like enzyme